MNTSSVLRHVLIYILSKKCCSIQTHRWTSIGNNSRSAKIKGTPRFELKPPSFEFEFDSHISNAK